MTSDARENRLDEGVRPDWRRRGDQIGIRLVIARGGTSRGLYLHSTDLPGPGPARDQLLARLLGSPDLLQVDGLGGSRPITSKIAIVGPSSRPDADVDYTFAQVGISSGVVGYHGNCGNISAGVGPFAIDEGLVRGIEGHTAVKIWNTNTGRIIIARVPVRDGYAQSTGTFILPGVPGSGAEIEMNWAGTVGSLTGKLLPTGKTTDFVYLDDGRRVEMSIVDAGNPCVWVRAAEVGLSGAETRQEINANVALLAVSEEIRGKAALALGLASHWRDAVTASPGLPMLGYVSPPVGYRTINDQPVEASDMDLKVHLLFMGVMHESIAGSGSVSLAAASRTPGTVVERLIRHPITRGVRIGHPSGITPCRVVARNVSQAPFVAFDDLGFSRTARRLMEGLAYVPLGP